MARPARRVFPCSALAACALLTLSTTARAAGDAPAAASNLSPSAPAASTNSSPQAASGDGSWNARAKFITEIALVSGAALSLGLGVALAVASHDELSAASALRLELPPSPPHSQCTGSSPAPPCASLQDHSQAAVNDSNWSTGFYVAAGVLATGALASWFFWPATPSSKSSGAVHLAPVASPRLLGAAMHVVW